MDETGLCVGVGCGQWVVVPAGQEQGRFTNLIGSHSNTEHVSVVETISADGVTVASLLIIIKGAVIQILSTAMAWQPSPCTKPIKATPKARVRLKHSLRQLRKRESG
jgi:hypothetical protein